MTQKRRPSSGRWLAEHAADPYVQEARRRGFRSRSVFKLQEIQQRDRILQPGMTIVDLGAAPGGWSQYARSVVGPRGRLIALDILPMEPLPDVEVITGDFREPAVLRQLEESLAGRPVDLVLSDMAPNISGVSSADQAASIYLDELALEFARRALRPGGSMLIKAFQGEGFDAYLKNLRGCFAKVAIRKPKASRPRSREVYLLARNFAAV